MPCSTAWLTSTSRCRCPIEPSAVRGDQGGSPGDMLCAGPSTAVAPGPVGQDSNRVGPKSDTIGIVSHGPRRSRIDPSPCVLYPITGTERPMKGSEFVLRTLREQGIGHV